MMLNYHKIGNGSKILLAFHGIGQDFSCFMNFAEAFSERYTTFLFDLPFHGTHIHQEPFIITKQLWQDILIQFFEKEKIQDFDVIGFSIGGRFALATFEAFADRINHITLLAPDGIKINPLYKLATGCKAGKWIFKRVISSHSALLKIGIILHKLGVVSKSTVRMANFMLDTPLKQKQIYYAWIGFKELQFDIPRLINLAQQSKSDFSFFVGKYDQLLPPKQILPLSKGLPKQQTIVLNTGHSRLIEKVIVYLKKEGFSLQI
ncbi:alpha/beta hydrolase [Flectobacillus longus]|uniref:alpha/beta hydrolase n=1 Tax=Flectobacillus longus TaxID=2984207 RepID=UPI0024B6F439|nr:alpha/beta hydrolase [Flectobacillus longus]MDI9882619.1 alpha/beta hydrolase [Flectobacillus longus]